MFNIHGALSEPVMLWTKHKQTNESREPPTGHRTQLDKTYLQLKKSKIANKKRRAKRNTMEKSKSMASCRV